MVLFGMLAAMTFALKVVMSALPNIEPVSLMVMLEILCYGIDTWSICYLYVWAILAVAAMPLRKMEHPLWWAMLSGVFGLLFGALCAIVDIFLFDWAYAVTKWTSGIMFDIYHCFGNFVIALVLFRPLRNLLEKLYLKMRRS